MRWHIGIAVAALLAASACGLPSDNSPQSLDPSSVPFGLLDPQPSTPSSVQPGPATPIYFVHGAHLAETKEHVSFGANVPEEALRQLLAGPTTTDVASGATSSIPAETRLISLDVRSSIASIDLSDDFAAVGGSDQVFAVAQIVLTVAASSSDISKVRFLIDGRHIEVPDAHGSLSPSPRSASDYRALVGQSLDQMTSNG